MKVSVLGGGNGGCALAFHLVQMGHEVLVYQRNNILKATQKIVAVKQTDDGMKAALHGVSPLAKTTSDMKEAVGFSNYLLLIVPAYAQSSMFKSALPYLTKDHTFVSLPGNFAFLDYMKVMHETSGGRRGIPNVARFKREPFIKAFVELSTIPYASRLLSGNEVFIGGLKDLMHVGVFPSEKTDDVIESIKPLFIQDLEKNKNVIETGFCNLNFILHSAITIYNAGCIESMKGDFFLYKQGLSPTVARLMETLDKERVAVAASLGFTVEDIVTTWKKWYGINNINSMADIPEKGTPYKFVKAPASLDNRFIWEDMLYMLLPIIKYIGKGNNVPTPLADAIVTSASALLGRQLQPARHFHGNLKDYMDI